MLKAAIIICVLIWVVYAVIGAGILKQVNNISAQNEQLMEQIKKDLEL